MKVFDIIQQMGKDKSEMKKRIGERKSASRSICGSFTKGINHSFDSGIGGLSDHSHAAI